MNTQIAFAERVESDPWGLIEEALLHEAKQEPVPEALQDAVQQAAMLLTSIALVRAGATFEQIEHLMVDRDWSTRISYNRETREFACEINWTDGDEQLVLNGSPERAVSAEDTPEPKAAE